MADEEGSQRYPPFKVLDKPSETFCSCAEKEKSAPVEEKDICIPDICPICCSICSSLPPVAWRSSAATMTAFRWRLLATDTNWDLIAVFLRTLNGSLNPNVGRRVDRKIHGDRAQLGLFSYPADISMCFCACLCVSRDLFVFVQLWNHSTLDFFHLFLHPQANKASVKHRLYWGATVLARGCKPRAKYSIFWRSTEKRTFDEN